MNLFNHKWNVKVKNKAIQLVVVIQLTIRKK